MFATKDKYIYHIQIRLFFLGRPVEGGRIAVVHTYRALMCSFAKWKYSWWRLKKLQTDQSDIRESAFGHRQWFGYVKFVAFSLSMSVVRSKYWPVDQSDITSLSRSVGQSVGHSSSKSVSQSVSQSSKRLVAQSIYIDC